MTAATAGPATVATRTAYRDWLVGHLLADQRAICLDTDTGLFAGVDFGAAAERYVNLGIAEHNLIGVAAGLAASGWRPYVNTMATFAATRALEAVKVDVAYNHLPVRIVATHAGLSAGHLGPTHHALEDLAALRALPGLTVAVPADAGSAVSLLVQTTDLPGPLYLRLGRRPTPALPPGADAEPELGRLQVIRPGGRVVLVGCGPPALHAALGAARQLADEGVDTGLLHAHTLRPFDAATLLAHTARAELVVTVEEHWLVGGLGSAVAEALAEAGPADGARRLLRVGLPDEFVSAVGDQDHLLARYGITADGVADRVRATLAAPPGDRDRTSNPKGASTW